MRCLPPYSDERSTRSPPDPRFEGTTLPSGTDGRIGCRLPGLGRPCRLDPELGCAPTPIETDVEHLHEVVHADDHPGGFADDDRPGKDPPHVDDLDTIKDPGRGRVSHPRDVAASTADLIHRQTGQGYAKCHGDRRVVSVRVDDRDNGNGPPGVGQRDLDDRSMSAVLRSPLDPPHARLGPA